MLRFAEVLAAVSLVVVMVSVWQAHKITDAQRNACERDNATRAALRLFVSIEVADIETASEKAASEEVRAAYRLLLPRAEKAAADPLLQNVNC